MEKCLTWGLLPARGQDILVFWLCEGRRAGPCSLPRVHQGNVEHSAGQVLTSWRVYSTPKSCR